MRVVAAARRARRAGDGPREVPARQAVRGLGHAAGDGRRGARPRRVRRAARAAADPRAADLPGGGSRRERRLPRGGRLGRAALRVRRLPAAPLGGARPPRGRRSACGGRGPTSSSTTPCARRSSWEPAGSSARWRARSARARSGQPLVAAQEVEGRMSARDEQHCPVASERPELYFCSDLEGYGWIFRKGSFLNVGFGRRDGRSFPARAHAFWGVPARIGARACGFRPALVGPRVQALRREGAAARRRRRPSRRRRGRPRLLAEAAKASPPRSSRAASRLPRSWRRPAASRASGSRPTRPRSCPASARRRSPAAAARVPHALRASLAGLVLAVPFLSRHMVLDPDVPAPAAGAAHGPRSLFRRTGARPRLSPAGRRSFLQTAPAAGVGSGASRRLF